MKVRAEQFCGFHELLTQYKPLAESSSTDYMQHIIGSLKQVSISVVALYHQPYKGKELPTIRLSGVNRGFMIVIMDNSPLDCICQLLLAAVILHCEAAALDEYNKYTSSSELFSCEPTVQYHYQELLLLAKQQNV